jgi:16S rRNA (guanine527-N7)-methyltransferase
VTVDARLSDLFGRFHQEAARMGVRLDPHQMDQFEVYLHELKEWNAVTRLISRDDAESVVWVHFLDSLTPLPYLHPAKNLLDIGSGAGFPGVPLKIALPGIPLHMVESQRRRVHFLKHLVRRLDLPEVSVHQGRIEGFRSPLLFHTIISRALAAPERWVSWACRFLEEEGQIILMLGRDAKTASLHPLLEALGLRLRVHTPFRLPVIGHQRRILVLRKSPRFT